MKKEIYKVFSSWITYDEKMVKYNYMAHDVNSSLLIGNIKSDDTIKRRIK